MQTSLLRTKHYIPKHRPEYVPRPRLVEQLNAGLWQGSEFARKLTIVSAPAGFGKTTMISAWAREVDVPVAWISLDDNDNNPNRFFAYFVSALQNIKADLGGSALAMLQSPQPPAFETLLTSLINEISEITETILIIFDDYNVINAQPIHDALAFFLNNLPPQVHIVFSGRADPPWPLGQWRARGEMIEIRSNDLRFTLEEATVFLNQALGLQISPETVTALETRTEGWIAGLQLAAISLRGKDDISSFVADFTGSHRFVIDYLVEEVLDQQPGTVQDFLLKTSILERMSADLCDAVVGEIRETRMGIREGIPALEAPTFTRSSQQMLEYLERSNIFLISLDDHLQWYRYHHLFADLLRQRLNVFHPEKVPELYERASLWFEQHDMPDEAIHHAFKSGDLQRAARLIEANGQEWIANSELGVLLRWLKAMPTEIVRARPYLGLLYGWGMALINQFDIVEQVLEDAEKRLRAAIGNPEELREYGLTDPVEQSSFWGYLITCRAAVARSQGETGKTIRLLYQALDIFPEDDLRGRGVAYLYLGYALWMAGDILSARQNFEDALRVSQSSGQLLTTQSVIDALGKLLLEFGELKRAVRIHQQAIELANLHAEQTGGQTPGVGLAYNGLANLHYEWNEIEVAVNYANRGIELFKPWGVTENLLDSYNILARISLAQDNKAKALEVAQTAASLVQEPQVPDWLRAQVEAFQARLWIRLGRDEPDYLRNASSWAMQTELSADDEPSYFREFEYITLVRLYIAKGELDNSLNLLKRLLELVEPAGRNGRLIEILLLNALAHEGSGKTDQALRALARSLALAEPESYTRVFIDEGRPMAVLLQKAAARAVLSDYTRKLLTAFPKQERVPLEAAQTLTEPLSQRELEVLRLMSTGRSGPQIAEQMYLSINTVKTHIKNIYLKLGVNQRFEAIQKAKQLGLI